MPDITSFPIPTQDFDVAAFADCQFSVPTAAALVGLVASAGNRALVLDTMRQWRFDSVTWWDEGKSPVGLLKDAVSLAQAASAVIVGSWDASSGAFPLTRPDGSGIRVGDTWAVAVSGTTGGEFFEAGDYLQALKAGGSPVFAGSWARSATGQIKKWRDEAHRWATENEDVPVETSPDQFSAKHHARKAAASAASAALYDGPWLDDVAALLADTALTYTAGQPGTVVAGDIVRTRAEGFAYRVVALDSTDYDWATAGGVLLYLLPGDAGHYNFAGMNPYATGLASGDDYPKLKRLLDRPGTGTGWYQSSPPIYFPNGRYFMGQTIQLKRSTRLFGNSSGLPSDAAAELVFPSDTAGIIVHRYNTIGYTTEAVPTTAADASIIEGLILTGSRGTDLTAHGIWLRARAVVRNVRIQNFAGAGFRPYAASNGTAAFLGNCNNWVFDTGRVLGCEWGVYPEGYDANAGRCLNVDCSGNRRWGFFDASFLGNTFTACHADGNGREIAGGVNVKSAYASYGGKTYHAVPGATEQQLVDTEPGTNSAIWRQCQTTSYAIAWTGSQPSGTYRHGGGYHSNNANARSIFTGCYNEGGQGLIWLSQHSIMVGGMTVETPIASGAQFEGRFNATWSRQPFVSGRTRISDGRTITAATGGDANSLAAFEWSDSINNQTYRWQASGTLGSFEMSRQGAQMGIAVRGPNETQLPNYFQLVGLGLGIGGTLRAFGRTTWSTAAGVVFPTSGNYNKGDVGLAPNPNAGDRIGWVCTTSGVAGSTAVFKPFGAIDA